MRQGRARTSSAGGGRKKEAAAEARIAALKSKQAAWMADRQRTLERSAEAVERRKGGASTAPASGSAPGASPPTASISSASISSATTSATTSTSRFPATFSASTSCIPEVAPPHTIGASFGDDVLHRLTERITAQLRNDLQHELRKEAALEMEKQEELHTKLSSYLRSEQQTHSCPICNRLMSTVELEPILVTPCGHTFCRACLSHHRTVSAQCPVCNVTMESLAVNQSLKALIDTFSIKRQEYASGQLGASLVAPPSRGLASAGASMMMGPGSGATIPVTPMALASSGRPPTTTGTRASAESVDKASRYLHDLKSYGLRWQIMKNELRAATEAVEASAGRVNACDHTLTVLKGEQESCNRRLEQVTAELRLVKSHIEEQETQRVDAATQLEEAGKQKQMVEETLELLQRDMNKARMMVEHLAPSLLDRVDAHGVPHTGS